MARLEKLLARARNNPRDVRYGDLLRLVEGFGFEFLRQEGSHRQYLHPGTGLYLNLQPDANGKAKTYQVRRFLSETDARGIRLREEHDA